MWEQLDPKTANLQSIYGPLLNKVVQADRPWSISEMKLSPNVSKRRKIYAYEPPSDFEVTVIGMINSWQVADELRFVGAI